MTTHEKIVERIKFCLKEDENIVGVRPITVTKNNSTEEMGVAVKMADTPMEMCVYMTEDIPRVEQGYLSMDACAEGVAKAVRENREKTDHKSLLPPMDWNYWKERIIFSVVNREKNEEMLKEIPHIPFLDLAVVFRLVIEPGYATAVITNTVVNHFEICLVDLIRAAESQYTEKENFGFQPMDEILADAGVLKEDPKLKKNLKKEGNRMWILSNHEKEFGAGLIADRAAMKRVGEILGDDFYILPSSIHELIIMKASCPGISKIHLAAVVRHVNRTNVSQNEWLSDHIYRYSRKQKEVFLVEA